MPPEIDFGYFPLPGHLKKGFMARFLGLRGIS